MSGWSFFSFQAALSCSFLSAGQKPYRRSFMKVALFSGAGAVKCAASTYTSVLKSGLEKAGHQVLLVTADPAIDDCFAQDGKVYCPAKMDRYKKIR